jgi:hypothetical protein
LPDDQDKNSSRDTRYLHQDITYECIRAFYATADADEEDVILHEKGTVESEYDNEVDDGED